MRQLEKKAINSLKTFSSLLTGLIGKNKYFFYQEKISKRKKRTDPDFSNRKETLSMLRKIKEI